MSTFAYIARDNTGQRVSGTLSGASEQSVLAELHARDLAPVSIAVLREGPRLRRRVGVRHLANAYRQLADLLEAGVPLLRALRLLGRARSNPRLAEVMRKVSDAVADGTRLADAMADHEDVFPSVQIAMVRAGERGGFLREVLARMGNFLELQAEMRSKVIGNLIYPVALLTLSGFVVIIALVFFVPKFEDFYTGIDAPLPTRMVLGVSSLLTDHWLLVLLSLVAMVVFLGWLRRREAVSRAMAVAVLRIPKAGPLIQNLAVSRFTRMLGTLLENGVPMLAAMQIARDAAGHVLMEEAIDEATEAVRAGEPLAEPLTRSGMLSEDVSEMISVGESANNLSVVLTTIADTIDRRIDRMLTIFVRLMEPMLLLALGGVVMFIFIALVIPMMRKSSQMAG